MSLISARLVLFLLKYLSFRKRPLKASHDANNSLKVILSGGTSHTPKIPQLLKAIFPSTTSILSPSTSPTAINPSDIAARGAAIQASLVQEFEKEDIEQSAHPMVTVAAHLGNPIGVQLVSAGENDSAAVFKPLMNAETALPARRAAQYAVPKEGGDILVRVCEGVREIKTTKPEPRKTTKASAADANEDDSDIDSDDDEDDEIREIVWKVSKPIAEFAIKGIKAGGKVEVMVNVSADLGVQITAREVGGKGGVRGAVESPKENGTA